ncbi:glycoside hydrolase family 3 protein [Moniliophthora roreri]|nr:glycoside hydrolase family 3 protein [Moniliophthora roreri]
MRARGIAMGKEHHGKDVHVAPGPGIDLFCVSQGRRNWESSCADPFLMGEAAYETISGMQQTGV